MKKKMFLGGLGILTVLLLPGTVPAGLWNEDPGPQCSGMTVCFQSPGYWLLRLDRLPCGTVFIGGYNMNTPVSVQNVTAIRMALQGSPVPHMTLTPYAWLRQEFVAAQLSLDWQSSQGSPAYYGHLNCMLACYGFDRYVTLSNGYTISPESTIGDLFRESTSVYKDRRDADMPVLAAIWHWLNGEDMMGFCHIPPRGELVLP